MIIVMPDTMSAERRSLMKAYGAEVVLSEGSKGMTGALETAAQLAEETKGAVIMGQFANPSNPAAHFCTTGPELWEDTGGRIDILVEMCIRDRLLEEQNLYRAFAILAAPVLLSNLLKSFHDFVDTFFICLLYTSRCV